jgi:hypothetical protein
VKAKSSGYTLAERQSSSHHALRERLMAELGRTAATNSTARAFIDDDMTIGLFLKLPEILCNVIANIALEYKAEI